MKAACYLKRNDLQIIDLDRPEIGCGEALIKVKYAGICGSDLHVYQGQHPTARFPIVPGHEFVGELIKLGESTTSEIKPGENVVVQPFFSCGLCEPCITGNDNVCTELKLLGAHCNGCFAEYVKVPAKKMCRIPNGTDLKLAALAEPLAVAVHDVRRSQLKVGQKALVIGGGPIGLLIAMVARMTGAEIYISEVNSFRINFAKDLGFDVINPAESDFQMQVDKATNGKNFDVVFEVSGSKAGIASMTKLAKVSGMIMIVGMASDSYPVDLMTIFSKQLKLQGVRIHSQEAFCVAVDILVDGRLNDQLSKLITRIYNLNDIKKVYNYIESDKEHFKILLEVI